MSLICIKHLVQTDIHDLSSVLQAKYDQARRSGAIDAVSMSVESVRSVSRLPPNVPGEGATPLNRRQPPPLHTSGPGVPEYCLSPMAITPMASGRPGGDLTTPLSAARPTPPSLAAAGTLRPPMAPPASGYASKLPANNGSQTAR